MQTCNPFVSANLLRLRDLLIPSNCAINGGSEATSVEANFLLFNKTQQKTTENTIFVNEQKHKNHFILHYYVCTFVVGFEHLQPKLIKFIYFLFNT